MQAAPVSRSWRLVCFIVIAVFVLRGIALLAILPPLEGWDEYQHLARIAFVVETGRSPVVNESMVPRSLFPAIAALPHGRLDIEQTHAVGALPYRVNALTPSVKRSYWDGPPPSPAANAPDIRLYQAQHGPLYYWLMTPIYQTQWDPAKPLACIFALRLINLVFGAAAVSAVLWTLSRLVVSVQHRIWIALLLGVQPLFLLNVARVANDAAAVCFGIAATGLLLVYGRRGGIWVGVFTGALAGLAVLSKSVALVLLPFAIAVPLAGWWKRETTVLRAFKQIAFFVIVFFIMTGDYFYSNWKTYGVAVPMQETIRNESQHRGLVDLLGAMTEIDWWRQLRSRVCRDSLWVGGWSFLALPAAFRGVHESLIVISIAGLAWGAIRRRRASKRGLPLSDGNILSEAVSERPVFDFTSLALMSLMIAGALAGLAYHTLQSKLAYDSITTNVWYACLSFPWMIALLVYGADGLRIRGAAAWVAVMMILCLTAECVGLFGLMPEAYTGLTWSPEARERLALVHPAWLAPNLAIPLEATAVALAFIVFWMSMRGLRISPPSRLRPSGRQHDPAH